MAPSIIPGLTTAHFMKNNGCDGLMKPTLVRGKVNPRSGKFNFRWQLPSELTDDCPFYLIQALGNIVENQKPVGCIQWWGFRCRCSCPRFAESENTTMRHGNRELHLCDHLGAALSMVVDPSASISRIECNAKVTIPGLTSDNFDYDGPSPSEQQE